MDIIIWLAVGLLAGFLASRLFNKGKKSIIFYLIIGLIGSLLGGWIFSLFQIATSGIIGDIIAALLGSVIVIYLLKKIAKI